jgi:penicillin-binding protein 1A
MWEPGNYGDKYHGEVTILEALTHSYNTVAVRVGHMTGIDKILNLARDVGFTSPHLPADLSLSLGSASVTPLEMAAAYSVFANGGYRIRPYGIKRVTTAAGEILEQRGPEPVPAVEPELVTSIRSVLENVVRAGTGRRAAIQGYETFGKTGTTNEYTDAWFAGGLPGLVAVVYAGNDDNKSLGHPGTGGVVAAPVWKDFVEKAITRLPVRQQFALNQVFCRRPIALQWKYTFPTELPHGLFAPFTEATGRWPFPMRGRRCFVFRPGTRRCWRWLRLDFLYTA